MSIATLISIKLKTIHCDLVALLQVRRHVYMHVLWTASFYENLIVGSIGTTLVMTV